MKVFRIILYLILVLSFLQFTKKGITNPHLSFDEAGQFWMSKGLNHISPIDKTEGTFKNMMIQNRTWNMDPGGFSMIGFIWFKFCNSIFWVRLLPFLFALVSLFVLSRIISFLDIPYKEALVLSFIFFLSNSLVTYSFTFRAYGFEILGVLLLLYLILKFKNRYYDIKVLLKFSIVFNLFLWSRYGFVIPIVVTNCSILLLGFSKTINKTTFIKNYVMIVVIPLLINFIILYYYQLQFHLVGGYVPTYKNQYTMLHQSFFNMVELNLFSRRGMPFLIFTVLMGINLILKKVELSQNIKLLFFWMIGIHIINLILSVFGLYPWYIKGRWGLTLEFISLLSLLILIIEMIKFCRQRDWLINKHFEIIFLIFSIAILNFRKFNQYNNCINFLTKFKHSESNDAFISGYLTPASKYNLIYNHELKSLGNLKSIRLEGIDKMETRPKLQTWLLISNDDPTTTKNFLKKFNFRYKIIFNEHADNIIEVVE